MPVSVLPHWLALLLIGKAWTIRSSTHMPTSCGYQQAINFPYFSFHIFAVKAYKNGPRWAWLNCPVILCRRYSSFGSCFQTTYENVEDFSKFWSKLDLESISKLEILFLGLKLIFDYGLMNCWSWTPDPTLVDCLTAIKASIYIINGTCGSLHLQ